MRTVFFSSILILTYTRTPDGTTLLATTASSHLHSFILPPSLLTAPDPSTALQPYTTYTFPTPITTFTPYPLYELANPSTALLLVAPNALPLRLINTLSPDPTPLATYLLICPTTEAYLTPASLVFSSPTTFLAGTDCLITLFDVTRNGEGPLTRLPTIPSKRHKMKGGGVGMRGIVSALGLQPTPVEDTGQGILAAGTWTRSVGLYDIGGLGGTVATWSVAHAADVEASIGGTGVTQTLWSSCGRYLYVAERQSDGVLVYDVRVTGKLVAWLTGRCAETNQRLGVDVFEGSNGPEIWCGGTDGVVRIWEGVGLREGEQRCTSSWKAHDDSIGSTVVHSSGTVVATCSGQRAKVDDIASDSSGDESTDEDDRSSITSTKSSISSPDNSLKVWAL